MIFSDATASTVDSNELFQRLLDRLPVAAYTCDADGLITYFNAAAEAIWGRAPRLRDAEDRYCGSFRLFTADGTPIKHEACWMALAIKQRKPFNGREIVIERHDGRRIRALAHANPVERADGTLIGAINVLVDITAQKQAEQSLADSEARLQAIIATTPECVKIVDSKGRLVSMNHAGLCMIEADGMAQVANQSIYSIIAEEDRARFEAFNDRVCRGSGGILQFDIVGLRGKRRSMETHAVPFPSENGFLHLAITRDVTEQKRAEQKLRETDRRKNEFLAVLAHELRNPLAPIRNSTRVLMREEGLSDRGRAVLDVVERQVAHMARLIDDLMDVSRITEGRIQLRKETLGLDAVLGNAIDSVRSIIEARRHRLILRGRGEDLQVEGDPVRLHQVFVNVLGNAAKYMGDGGTIEVSVGAENGAARVSVRDEGLGIPAHMLESIFDAFVQVREPHSAAGGEGLGIGLSLVKALVDMHGGSIRAESGGPGTGSTFTISLPLTAPAPVRPAETHVSGEQTLASMRVLVVDDNRDAADSLAMLLADMCGDVKAVYDGRQVRQEIESFIPDVVLLDIGMPYVSGYEVAEAIRKDQAVKELPLVALTGWGQAHDKQRSAAAGFDAHLVKPVDLPDLVAVLVRVHGQAASGGGRRGAPAPELREADASLVAQGGPEDERIAPEV